MVFIPIAFSPCGLFQSQFFSGYTVTGTEGSEKSSSYPESEVIDLESDNGGDCNRWTEFPYEVYGGTGALFNVESAKGTEGIF